MWQEGYGAPSKQPPRDQGFGEEGPKEEWGLSWGAGKAGQAGKAKEGKGGCMPHPRAQTGGLPPPVHPSQVPTIQSGARSTSQPPPEAAVTIQVTMARR